MDVVLINHKIYCIYNLHAYNNETFHYRFSLIMPPRTPSEIHIQGGPGYVDTIIFSVITCSQEKPIAEMVMYSNWPESENI